MKGLVRTKGGRLPGEGLRPRRRLETTCTTDKNKITIEKMKATKKIADTEIHSLKNKLRVQTHMRKMAESEVEDPGWRTWSAHVQLKLMRRRRRE
jgi:hypothetical protein